MIKLYHFSFILLFLFSIIPNSAIADKYMGNELTWECIPSGQPDAGKYIFQVKLYRNCGMTSYGNTITIYSYSPAGSITLFRVNSLTKDISPVCNSDTSFSHITCAGATYSNNGGAIQVFTYRSQAIQLNGTPPANGWLFYRRSCCRNPTTNLLGQLDYSIRAVMYPYGTSNMYPCYDNSPTFAEEPKSIICTGYARSFNYYASDKELDSLVYEFGQPKTSTGQPISYAPGYSYLSPLPGPTQNVNNVAATINSQTGEISFTSHTSGVFLTSVKVSAYKCGGVKVAEIWREFHLVLTDCDSNAKPEITLSQSNGTPVPDTIFAYAGDKVSFDIHASSFQFLPNATPKTVELNINGTQFGNYIPASSGNPATMDSMAGCINPPCATLSPAIGHDNPLSGALGVQTTFSWQTDCGHMVTNGGCIHHLIDEYRFSFFAKDDYCPVPNHNATSVVIKILPPKSPELKINNIHYNYTLMTSDLSWIKYIDPDSSFIAYDIFHSDSLNGAFTLIDSILNVNQIVYSHNIGLALQTYYYIRLRTLLCNRLDTSLSDTLSLFITALNSEARQTNFELFQNEPNPANGKTKIRYSINIATKGKFQLMDISGRIVLEQSLNSYSGMNEIILETSQFSKGIYYYRVNFGEASKTRKLIVL